MSKVIIYDNGDKYVGDIKNKEKHGIGTYTWSDGSTYYGEWKKNKKHGHGTFKDAKGETLIAIWNNGEFKDTAWVTTYEKIDINYLKKNFNLKKFLKTLNKTSKDSEYLEIYKDFLNSCSTKKISGRQLYNAIEYYGDYKKLFMFLHSKFLSGKFFPFISNNFKVLKLSKVYGPPLADLRRSSYHYQLISSKIDKKYYIAVYKGYNFTDDGYYITKIVKDKKLAVNFIKQEIKERKKQIN